MKPPVKSKKAPAGSAALLKTAQRQLPAAALKNRLEPAMLAKALASRPRVDFQDPLMQYAAMRAKGIGLCAFLVSLAAFQRGLKVTFHYERASFDPRFAQTAMQGHRGEIFSLSDGRRTHAFSRTMGDLVAPAANAIAEDKHLTKRVLTQAGVSTPEGIVLERGQTALVEKFVAHAAGRRFVVKPVAGTMGRDVHTDLPAECVLPILATIKDPRAVVEEYVEGEEYRALVVAGRCVAIYRRHAANVVGDGVTSVRALIAKKNAQRQHNPHLASKLIDDKDGEHLAQQGVTFDSVPAAAERVVLSSAANVSRGGDTEDMTSLAPPAVAHEAIKACAAVGLDVAGVDLIVKGDGPDAQAYVIELNQRPHIGGHSFPVEGTGQGNAVAEAIVDFYFPETVEHAVHPGLAYDFAAIQAALDSAQVAELCLPTVGPDWRVLRHTLTGVTARAMAQLLQTAAKAAGGYVMAVPMDKGVELCLAAAPANARMLLNLMPAQFRANLAGPLGDAERADHDVRAGHKTAP